MSIAVSRPGTSHATVTEGPCLPPPSGARAARPRRAEPGEASHLPQGRGGPAAPPPAGGGGPHGWAVGLIGAALRRPVVQPERPGAEPRPHATSADTQGALEGTLRDQARRLYALAGGPGYRVELTGRGEYRIAPAEGLRSPAPPRSGSA